MRDSKGRVQDACKAGAGVCALIARHLAGESSEEWIFDISAAGCWLTRALRLRRDLELDSVAVAMLIDLPRQRESLQRENRCLRQQLERFLLGGGDLPGPVLD